GEVGRAGMLLEVGAVERVDFFFDQMVDLHHRRWQAAGRVGSFAPRHVEFHRSLARLIVPQGNALLVRLRLADQPFAVAYGHRVGNTYHCYQRGVSLQTEQVRSPGTAVLLLLMRYLIDQGVTCYDHLVGGNPFKERFSTEEYTLVRLRAVRPTIRSLVSSITNFARRGTRKALALVRRA